MYDFKKFTKVSQRSVNKITITSSYAFGFPKKFFKDNNINDFKFVIIYYDEQNAAVGFQFTNDEEEKYKFRIIKSKEGYGGSIIATSFFKTNNLEPKEIRGKYEWEKTPIEGIGELFIINLRKTDQKDPAFEELMK